MEEQEETVEMVDQVDTVAFTSLNTTWMPSFFSRNRLRVVAGHVVFRAVLEWVERLFFSFLLLSIVHVNGSSFKSHHSPGPGGPGGRSHTYTRLHSFTPFSFSFLVSSLR